MTKPNTTVDFAAYGLCDECAETFADFIHTALARWDETHITHIVLSVGSGPAAKMDITISEEKENPTMQRFIKLIAKDLLE